MKTHLRRLLRPRQPPHTKEVCVAQTSRALLLICPLIALLALLPNGLLHRLQERSQQDWVEDWLSRSKDSAGNFSQGGSPSHHDVKLSSSSSFFVMRGKHSSKILSPLQEELTAPSHKPQPLYSPTTSKDTPEDLRFLPFQDGRILGHSGPLEGQPEKESGDYEGSNERSFLKPRDLLRHVTEGPAVAEAFSEMSTEVVGLPRTQLPEPVAVQLAPPDISPDTIKLLEVRHDSLPIPVPAATFGADAGAEGTIGSDSRQSDGTSVEMGLSNSADGHSQLDSGSAGRSAGSIRDLGPETGMASRDDERLPGASSQSTNLQVNEHETAEHQSSHRGEAVSKAFSDALLAAMDVQAEASENGHHSNDEATQIKLRNLYHNLIHHFRGSLSPGTPDVAFKSSSSSTSAEDPFAAVEGEFQLTLADEDSPLTSALSFTPKGSGAVDEGEKLARPWENSQWEDSQRGTYAMPQQIPKATPESTIVGDASGPRKQDMPQQFPESTPESTIVGDASAGPRIQDYNVSFMDNTLKAIKRAVEAGQNPLQHQEAAGAEEGKDASAGGSGGGGSGGGVAAKRWRTCAVVGNSGSLKTGRQLGEVIDSHDVVIRVNNAPTRGFESLVGSKTNFSYSNSHIIGSCGPHMHQNPYIGCRCFMEYGPQVPLVAYQCVAQHQWFLQSCMNISQDLAERYPVGRPSWYQDDWIPPQGSLLLVPNEFVHMCDDIVRVYDDQFLNRMEPQERAIWYGRQGSFEWSSSGMHAVTLSLLLCDKVTLFGFGGGHGGPRGSKPHHYHDAALRVSKGHNFPAERDYYKDVEAGRWSSVPVLGKSGATPAALDMQYTYEDS